MAITYPTTLDTTVGKGPVGAYTTTAENDGTYPHGGAHTDISAGIVALETLVGVTNSAVTTSHEYRIRKFPFKQWVAALEYSPPATLYGVFGVSNLRPHIAFNDSATWGALFFGIVPPGAVLGSGLIVRLKWKSITVTSGAAVWGVALERLTTAENADSLDTQGTATTTTSGTAHILVETAITITTIDSMVAGDGFMLQVQRIGANGSDTLVGDACLRLVSIESAA